LGRFWEGSSLAILPKAESISGCRKIADFSWHSQLRPAIVSGCTPKKITKNILEMILGALSEASAIKRVALEADDRYQGHIGEYCFRKRNSHAHN